MSSSAAYSVYHVVFAAAALSAAVVAWIANGHAGLVAATGVAVGLCLISDLAEALRGGGAHGKPDPPRDEAGAALPRGPALPVQWPAALAGLEAAALFSQLICGWTVLCGMLLLFALGGCCLLHLKYFSGTFHENARTLLPTLALVVMTVAMVFTAPVQGLGYRSLGLHDRSAAMLWLLVSVAAGAGSAQVFLYFLGIAPLGESAPILGASSRAGP